MKYTVGSLFSGVGGIDLGFEQVSYKGTSYEILWANDFDEYAAATYRENFKHPVYVGDIEKVVKPHEIADEKEREKYSRFQNKILSRKIDVLLCGFPCQSFSIAGYRKGFEDNRGNVFWSIIDLIRLMDKTNGKPSVLFIENVKNLQTHDQGRTFKIIKKYLESLGYKIKDAIINTKDITHLPQNRERIYIVAFLDVDVARQFYFFEQIKNMTINRTENDRIKDIKKVLNLNITKDKYEKYYYTKKKYPAYFLTEEEYNDIPIDERKKHRVNIEEQVDEKFQFYQLRRGMYIRKNKSGVCPTLTANMGTGGHNVPLIRVDDGVRKLTPEETFKLQGFPIGKGYNLPRYFKNRPFADGRLYKQAGNAVSVDVAKLIAKEILIALYQVNKISSKTNNFLIVDG